MLNKDRNKTKKRKQTYFMLAFAVLRINFRCRFSAFFHSLKGPPEELLEDDEEP